MSPKNKQLFSFKHLRKNPFLIALFFFIALIFIGSVLLELDARFIIKRPSNYIDNLFTATTSTCVTGISVFDNFVDNYSYFGKTVIIVLMYVGGLGFVTLLSFIMFFKSNISREDGKIKIGRVNRFQDNLTLKETLGESTVRDAIRYLPHVIIAASVIQIIGSIVFIILFLTEYSNQMNAGEAIFNGIFHAVSSFNNAGIDLFGNTSLTAFKNDTTFMIFTMILIVFGGIGFTVFYRIYWSIKTYGRKWIKGLDTNTKIVFLMTFILLLIGGLVYWPILASQKDISSMDIIFSSVTARTAGFTTFDVSNAPSSYYAWSVLLMFVGGAPCSAAGGIKVTTFFVVLCSTFSKSTGHTARTISKNISKDTVTKALSIVAFALIAIFFGTFVISLLESNCNELLKENITLGKIIYLTTSAYCTVGLAPFSLGALTIGSKITLILLMILGRLGLWNILSAFNTNWSSNQERENNLPDANIYIG